MDEESKMIRQEIRFEGMVQGVGFRYRARYAASGCRVTGWVKNEWDGSVLMEAQGTQKQIYEMLKLINQGSYKSLTLNIFLLPPIIVIIHQRYRL